MRGLYLGVAALAIVAGAWLYTRARPHESTPTIPHAFVDSAQCTGCHAAESAGFLKTGMGRSFARPKANEYASVKPYYHAASDMHFAMIERGGELFQRRWQTGFDGKEIHVEEKRVDYVMG